MVAVAPSNAPEAAIIYLEDIPANRTSDCSELNRYGRSGNETTTLISETGSGTGYAHFPLFIMDVRPAPETQNPPTTRLDW